MSTSRRGAPEVFSGGKLARRVVAVPAVAAVAELGECTWRAGGYVCVCACESLVCGRLSGL